MDRKPGVFWRPNHCFIDELSQYLSGRRVLELFSGNGYLASLLKERQVNIKATTLFSSHDCHEDGLYTEIEEIEAERAVIAYGSDFDALLLSWPTTTQQALRAIMAWGPVRPIIYIGEKTDLERNIYGGCATDTFFECIRIEEVFKSYKGNIIEIAAVIYYDLNPQSFGD